MYLWVVRRASTCGRFSATGGELRVAREVSVFVTTLQADQPHQTMASFQNTLLYRSSTKFSTVSFQGGFSFLFQKVQFQNATSVLMSLYCAEQVERQFRGTGGQGARCITSFTRRRVLQAEAGVATSSASELKHTSYASSGDPVVPFSTNISANLEPGVPLCALLES